MLAFAINPRIADSAHQIWNLKQLASLALGITLPPLFFAFPSPWPFAPYAPYAPPPPHPPKNEVTHPASFPRWQYLVFYVPNLFENRIASHLKRVLYTFVLLSECSPKKNMRIFTLIHDGNVLLSCEKIFLFFPFSFNDWSLLPCLQLGLSCCSSTPSQLHLMPMWKVGTNLFE